MKDVQWPINTWVCRLALPLGRVPLLFYAGETPPQPAGQPFPVVHLLTCPSVFPAHQRCSSRLETRSPMTRTQRCSWLSECGTLEFPSSPCPWRPHFPDVAQKPARRLLRALGAGVRPSLGPFKSLPASPAKEEVWHSQLLGS